jgi:HD-GYP domain-containing protein (c-di-GMP phosphodiesterase class II)
MTTQGTDAQSSLAALADADLKDPQVLGRLFFDSIFRILKVGSIYGIERAQTRMAAEEFMQFFAIAQRHIEDDSMSVMIRDELAIVNGTTLRLDRLAQKRHNELRDIFAAAKIRGLELKKKLGVEEFFTFLGHLDHAAKNRSNMEHVKLPHIVIAHGEPIRSIIEAVSKVNQAMYVAHVYIRGLVKVENLINQVREKQDPDVPMGVYKRVLQSISDLLSDDDFTILGLLPMKLVPASLGSHSFNSAIYTMLMADRLGLPVQLVTGAGMAVLFQDVDRLVGIAVGHRDRESLLDAESQFHANLRDVAKMLPRVEGDAISTLRLLMTYERGCSFDQPITQPFYRTSRNLHLVTRLIDLCRTYDLLIQGLEGYKARRPDLAMQYIQSRAGEAFDADLVELFVSTMGIFPIGTTVELTSGERAIVVRTPAPSADPRRPVVKLTGRSGNVLLDLSDRRYAHIEIARSVQTEEQDFASSRMFLLT